MSELNLKNTHPNQLYSFGDEAKKAINRLTDAVPPPPLPPPLKEPLVKLYKWKAA